MSILQKIKENSIEALKEVDETGNYFPGVGILLFHELVEWQHHQWGLIFLGHVILAKSRADERNKRRRQRVS